MSLRAVKMVFLISAAYDIILGIIFGLFFRAIYLAFGATLPNHDAYVQLPAILILIFGIGFYFVYKNPERNRDIVTLGILMKLGFVAVVIGHLVFDSIPHFYIPFALADAIFIVLFVNASKSLRQMPSMASSKNV